MMDEAIREIEYHINSCKEKRRCCELELAKVDAFSEGLQAAYAILKGIKNDQARRNV